MHRRSFVLLLIVALSLCSLTFAQESDPDDQDQAPAATPAPPTSAKPKAETPEEKRKGVEEEKPVATHHEIRIRGAALKYTATAGLMPLESEQGEVEAHIFYTAYTLDNQGARRPLTFVFNGGPGAASVWLHLGALGPRKVRLLPDGAMPHPPFELEDNQDSWLDKTDLVFIDPVGTGYSRASKPEYGKKFWSVEGDIQSVGEFIRLYLSRNQRWSSPLFLAGESYGTTRAAGLSSYLIGHGVALNGIVLISTVLNFGTLEFTRGNDLPYILYLPTYAATAWYHKKLPPDLEQQEVTRILPEVERWASNEYTLALAKGDKLTGAERQAVADQLARYTGLSKTYVQEANLRVSQAGFCKELLRDQNRTVGRLDSRFLGIDETGVSDSPDYDPSEATIRPPFTSSFNGYIRNELGYKSDKEYYVLGGGFSFRQWDWGSASEGYPNVAPDLRAAFVRNKYMKLFVAEGYDDLATPYYAVDYTLNHLGLDASLRGNITTGQYYAGHMVYLESKSLHKLKDDVASFMAGAIQ